MPVAYNFDTNEALSLDPNTGEWVKSRYALNPKTGAVAVEDLSGGWKEVEEKRGAFTTLDRMVRKVASGATFGLADEFAAKMDEIFGRGNYAQNVEQQRATDRRFAEDNPMLSAGAEIAGAVAPALLTMGAAAPATAMGRVGVGALTGAATGAASGFGGSEGGFANRMEGAQQGAMLGGALGGAAPVVASIAGSVARPIIQPIAARLSRTPATAAGRKIAEAAQRSDMTEADLQAALQRLGPQATLADVSPALTQLGGSMARLPGRTEQLAQDILQSRAEGVGQRVAQQARQELGTVGDFYQTADTLMKQRSAAAAPLYEKAYANTVEITPDLKSILTTPAGKSALNRAARIAANEQRDIGQLGLAASEAGDVTIAGTPTMQTLDYVKRGFDDVLEQYRDKTTGKLVLDTEGRSIERLRRNLVGALDEINPDYAAARQAFAGPSQSLDAMAQGRNLFARDSELTSKAVASMTPGEKQFFLEGVTRAIDDRLGAGTPISAVRRMMTQQNMADKLSAAFPDNKSYRNFVMSLKNEQTFDRTRQAVLGGSQTAQRLAQQADAQLDIPAEAIAGLASGSPLSALSGAANIMRRITALPESQRDEIGRMLFSQDPAMQRQALNAIGGAARMMNLDAARSLYRRSLLSGYLGGEMSQQSGQRP